MHWNTALHVPVLFCQSCLAEYDGFQYGPGSGILIFAAFRVCAWGSVRIDALVRQIETCDGSGFFPVCAWRGDGFFPDSMRRARAELPACGAGSGDAACRAAVACCGYKEKKWTKEKQSKKNVSLYSF